MSQLQNLLDHLPPDKREAARRDIEGLPSIVEADMTDKSLVDGIEDYARRYGLTATQERVAEVLLGLKRKY